MAPVGRRGQPRRAGQPALADPDASSVMRRCSCGPTAATARPPPAVLDQLPRHPVGSALAERDRRHRVLVGNRRRRESATGTASRWRVRTAGDRRATGSAGAMPPPAASTAEQGDNEHIPPFASLKKFIPARQAVADQRRMVLPRRIEPEKRCADQHSARRRPPLRGVRRCGGVRAQGAACALRSDPCPVRGVRRERLGQPQDDDLLDAQQPLAVVLRAPLRLLPAARRGLLRRQEGPAAACPSFSTPMRRATTTTANITVVNQTPD